MRKNIFNFWERRRERFYKKKRFHFFLDIFFLFLMLTLALLALRLSFYSPTFIESITPPELPIQDEQPIKEKIIDFEIEAQVSRSFIAAGSRATWSINFLNTGDVKIDKLELSLDSSNINFQLLDFIVSGHDSENYDVALESIDPGEERYFNLSIDWKNLGASSIRLLEAPLRVKSISENLILEKTLNLPGVKISGNLGLEADLYYHSSRGDQLGIGPIPPVVGIPTKYWLIIKASNYGNKLSDFIFSAQLAPGVQFAGEHSLLAGKFSYDESRSRLIWTLDELGPSGEEYIANFAVNLIPAENQIGENAVILNNIEYHASDDWTGENIYRRLPDLDSSLPADRLNRGEGKVLAE